MYKGEDLNRLVKKIIAEKPNAVNRLIKRAADKTEEKLKTLKTIKSKIRNIDAWEEDFKSYFDEMSKENIDLLNSTVKHFRDTYVSTNDQCLEKQLPENAFTYSQSNDNFANEKIIEVLNQESKERSDIAYNRHANSYNNLDFHDINIKSGNIETLTSTEKYFLKALSNQSVDELNFPVYWTYEYGINYNQLITKLIENGYIKISVPSEDFSFLTVAQLKELLKFFSLKISGRKQELIDRIPKHENIDDALKSLGLYKERFVLTPVGKQTIEFLPKSMTKNLEFEDKCLSLLMEQNFNEAYKEVCNWEKQKLSSMGGIDWAYEQKIGLSSTQLRMYTRFWKADISNKLPDQCHNYTLQIKACIILGNMLGVTVEKIAYLITRVVPDIGKDEGFVGKIQKIQWTLK